MDDECLGYGRCRSGRGIAGARADLLIPFNEVQDTARVGALLDAGYLDRAVAELTQLERLLDPGKPQWNVVVARLGALLTPRHLGPDRTGGPGARASSRSPSPRQRRTGCTSTSGCRDTAGQTSDGHGSRRSPNAWCELAGPSWTEFVPFLQFDVEIRKIVCTTNAIESINARIRKAIRARGHFPIDQAALKRVYLAVMSLDPTGTGRKRWKAALQAFDTTFDGRFTAGRR